MSMCRAHFVLGLVIISISACAAMSDDEEFGQAVPDEPDVDMAEQAILSQTDDDTVDVANDYSQDSDNDWQIVEREMPESLRSFNTMGGRIEINAEFAPYENASGGNPDKERIARLPPFVIHNSWSAESILDGRYRVWSTQTRPYPGAPKGAWWNGADHRKWVFDDTNLSHGHDFGQLMQTVVRPVHSKFNLGSGIIFMAYDQDEHSFRSIASLEKQVPQLKQLDVQYAYEVYSGTSFAEQFHTWFETYKSISATPKSKINPKNIVPVFDISAWSTDHCKRSDHVARKKVIEQIQFSTMYRAHHLAARDRSGTINIVFYSSCRFNPGDLQPLANWLGKFQKDI